MAEHHPPVHNDNNGPPSFALPQIQDIDDWLRFNGLRSVDDEPPQAECGSFLSNLNRSEAHAKHVAEELYQQQVHASIFQESLKAEEQQQAMRRRYLESLIGEKMEIVTPDSTISVPLCPLAAACDTIFTMASSRRYMDNVLGKSEGKEKEKFSLVRLSLAEYPTASIQEFLKLILNEKGIQDLDGELVVDCCHIGHYLQCPHIVERTTEILLQSIDSDNCLSLCQMADQLELPDLFERALFHMLKSLDDLESHEAYEAFSPELKDRIEDIRTVFTRHHVENTAKSRSLRKKTTLYFTSLEEYVAIFAENVQYHRERLEEAKEQNAIDYNSYAESKIKKQELRVLTLEAMLQEQKRVFGKKNHNKRKVGPY